MGLDQMFNQLNKASKKREILFKIQELNKSISTLQDQCGSCTKWMTGQCEREAKNKNHIVARNHDVCGKFEMNGFTTNLIKEHKLAIVSLEKKMQ